MTGALASRRHVAMMSPMTITEAAEKLGLSHHTVRNQVRAGRLAAEKRGRDYWITPAAVERYRTERLGKAGRPPKG